MLRPQGNLGNLRHVVPSAVSSIYTKMAKMISDANTPQVEKYQRPKIKIILKDGPYTNYHYRISFREKTSAGQWYVFIVQDTHLLRYECGNIGTVWCQKHASRAWSKIHSTIHAACKHVLISLITVSNDVVSGCSRDFAMITSGWHTGQRADLWNALTEDHQFEIISALVSVVVKNTVPSQHIVLIPNVGYE